MIIFNTIFMIVFLFICLFTLYKVLIEEKNVKDKDFFLVRNIK